MDAVLGISGGFGHDAAAAIVVDGTVIAAAEEERFTRQKRALNQVPTNAIQFCIDRAGLRVEDIACLAISWDPSLAPAERKLAEKLNDVLRSPVFQRGLPHVETVPHHLAHAALGYFTSGFGSAAIVIVDGRGESVSTSVLHGVGRNLTVVADWPIRDSLGLFYNAVTKYIGFATGAAGKTMGLAPFGSPTYDFPEIASQDGEIRNTVSGDADEQLRRVVRICEERFGPAGDVRLRSSSTTGLQRRELRIERHHADAARSAQQVIERSMLALVDLAVRKTRETAVVISGGVGLNCTANGRVRLERPNLDLWVHGAAHDGGAALGAALLVSSRNNQIRPDRSMYLGPAFDNLGSALDLARRLGLTVSAWQDVALEIERSRIGGWFTGRAEYGPRALGARSIVARADSLALQRRANRIKGRESWRPLAPVLTSDLAAALRIDTRGTTAMIEARWLDQEGALLDELAGSVHVDSSVRPLVVQGQAAPFARLLELVEERSGLRALLNTSFNVEDEPIVNSPHDAIRTFCSSELDFLVLGEALVCKSRI